MSALSPLFLWLLPLALLPVIIHLLNRLRYQTVRWAAMMFLRAADRDASRRAKIRQWLILAARCLMLLAFLLALGRLQSKGRLARFFDRGTNLVVILFDRSASMEQLRGGLSGRERALSLLNQGLAELGPGSRVLWMDSVTGQITPLPNAVDLTRLPLARPSETYTDSSAMLRAALNEIARAQVSSAEIWITTDRQASAWLPEGANTPDWSAWAGMDTQITLRLLDVGKVVADPGNRGLQLVSDPVKEGNQLRVQLRLMRDIESPESVPLRIDFGGLTLVEDIMVDGTRFVWEQTLQVESDQQDIHVMFTLPADSHNADNQVAVAWVDRGPARARVEIDDLYTDRVLRAALLPRDGMREVTSSLTPLDESIALWIRDAQTPFTEDELGWIRSGGVVLQLPGGDELDPAGEGNAPLAVVQWNEQSGLLSTEQREPLRLDLLAVTEKVTLPVPEGQGEILARFEDESPFLTRQTEGEGAVYRLATLPRPRSSNLDAGFVIVPVMQRLLSEGQRGSSRWGTQQLGEWRPGESAWESLDGEDLDPALRVGRYRLDGGVVALNRNPAEDLPGRIELDELKQWAQPLDLQVFEDRATAGDSGPSRVEFTSLLALLGLIFLAAESWLLTLNIRRPAKTKSAWSAAA